MKDGPVLALTFTETALNLLVKNERYLPKGKYMPINFNMGTTITNGQEVPMTDFDKAFQIV